MNKSKTNESGSSFQWLYPLITAILLASLTKWLLLTLFAMDLAPFYNWILYFGFYFISVAFFATRESKNGPQKKSQHPANNWPFPGLQGPLGKTLKIFCFVLSNLLSLLNPILLFKQLRLTFGMIKVSFRIKDKKDGWSDYVTKANYKLPFSGYWLAYHGGPDPDTSHSWQVLNQRYAYDFVKAESGFKRHQNQGYKLSDYLCYKEDILAAANGEVISVVDGVSDSPLIGWFFINCFTTQPAGNHIIIKHAEGEYGFYAHLLKDSIKLIPGDKVLQGQVIGLCGFSGNSTEPHLHFHIQDKPSFYESAGLPIKFKEVTVDGKSFNEASIVRGTFARNTSD